MTVSFWWWQGWHEGDCTHLNALQCLFSRWRIGETESVGPYPRHLKWVQSPSCRLCHRRKETVTHLISDCPGTSVYRNHHAISLLTLQTESPTNILKITLFDQWLRGILPFDSRPTDKGLDQALRLHLNKRKLEKDASALMSSSCKRRRRIVVHHSKLPRNLLKHKHKERSTPPSKRHKKLAVSSKDTGIQLPLSSIRP